MIQIVEGLICVFLTASFKTFLLKETNKDMRDFAKPVMTPAWDIMFEGLDYVGCSHRA